MQYFINQKNDEKKIAKRSNTNEEKATDFNWIELYFTFLYIVCVCLWKKIKQIWIYKKKIRKEETHSQSS